jgi:M6 family metalloprotease-like protein
MEGISWEPFMRRHPMSAWHVPAIVVLLTACSGVGQDPVKLTLSEYRGVDQAITTTIKSTGPQSVGIAGYLGISTQKTEGRLVISEVAEDSPAAQAGFQKGDLIKRIDGQEAASPDMFRETVQAHSPGAIVKVLVERGGKPIELKATLKATSRPMSLASQRPILGFSIDESKEGEGAAIARIQPDSPAARANLKVGEWVLKLDGEAIAHPSKLNDLIAEKKPGDQVTLTLKRDEKEVDVKLTLAGEAASRRMDFRPAGYWKKENFRLGVVFVEYPDVKHNAKVKMENWTELFFSKKTYTKRSATDQPVHGSVFDYYQELSYGALRLEGKVFDWVEVGKKRAEYSQGTGTSQAGKNAFLSEAIDKLYSRDGEDALKDMDGIIFVYAGDRPGGTSRGGLYWPHRGTFSHKGKRWNYAIFSEGGARMTNISVICHEFGHMLGLPDLYARPENPGSEGAGTWCAMSNQLPNGRPQHFSAWCKEKLGWIKPAVIDPTVRQKLILAPIIDSPRECYKVLVKLDGSEYFLLENRVKRGFDQDLPGEGLLIWRVVGNRPILEESHGVDGPNGPRVFVSSVPFPSPANQAFTPFTIPSSRSQLGGGLPVHITNIRKLPGGKIAFQIGYEYQ